MTFCPFFEDCLTGKGCKSAYTLKVQNDAKIWWGNDDPPICIYNEKPNCFKKK
jgi:hypothetical protein